MKGSSLLVAMKIILKQEGFTGKRFAGVLRIKYSTYRSMTRKSRLKAPRWVKSFVFGYNLGRDYHNRREKRLNKKNNGRKTNKKT